MTDPATPHYLALADQLGLDRPSIERGETIRADVTIASLEEFKSIVGAGLTEEQRDAYEAALQALPTEPDDDAAALDELKRHVFGRHAPGEKARAYAETVFPVAAKVMVAKDLVISTDETCGPNGESVIISCDTLTFDGGSISAITTRLQITARELNIIAGGKAPYHVGILGEDGEPGRPGISGAPHDGPAKAGKKAKPFSPGVCGADGGNGENGKMGNAAGDGENGDHGLPSLEADIYITEFAANCPNPFIVFNQSGSGGDGGDGGKGGDGQDGGDGGKGCSSGCTGSNGGDGGDAGRGADGRDGGTGGDAAPGNPIMIVFPAQSISMLRTDERAALPGKRGEAGEAGLAGKPGKKGSGGKHCKSGNNGDENSDGDPGKPGSPGAGNGAPGQFIIHAH